MTDIEHIIDRRIERAVRWYADSDTYGKYVAIAAGSVVGKYDGTTAAIAERIQRSVSTVENYAHAYWMYCHVRKTYPSRSWRTREMWHILPVSHWWLAWSDIHKKGGLVYDYLHMACIHNWSGREMLKEFQVDWEIMYGSPPPITPERHLQRARGIVEHILANLDSFDAAIVEWARMGLNLIGGQNDTR